MEIIFRIWWFYY